MNCSDCGYPGDISNTRTLMKGNSVREPGEMLCQSCTSSRVMLMRSLETIPNTLDQIKAKRMVRGAA